MNIKRTIFLIITLVAGAILWPIPSWGYTGTGTENDPYLVYNWSELKTCMNNGEYIRLEADCIGPDDFLNSLLSVPNTKTVTLDLNGYKIDRNIATATSNGYVIKNAGTLTICDSYTGTDRTHTISGDITISGGLITGGNNSCASSSDWGGGICNLGTLTLNGGTIAGNISNYHGGGVWNSSNTSSFTMTGGAISYNISKGNGGGVYSYYGTFTMAGGTICHNSATGEYTSSTGFGGGVYVNTFNLTGGKIEYNNCSTEKFGGGIYYFGTLNLSGNPIVNNNKRGNLDNNVNDNLYIVNEGVNPRKINITGSLSSTAKIGISVEYVNKVITNGLNENGVSTCFFSDSDDCLIISDNNEAKLITYWESLRARLSDNNGGSIELDRNYIAGSNDNQIYINGIVSLDLKGYMIDNNNKSCPVITINGNSSLTINDTYEGDNRKHTISVNGTPTEIIGGLITGGNTSYSGGGVSISNNGVLTLIKGTIAGNKAKNNGGGVNVNGSFTMEGGKICFNSITTNNSSYGGGGVYIGNNKTFTMSGGSIVNNTVGSSNYGGGVYLRSTTPTFNLKGYVTIAENTRGSSKNNVDITSPNVITITGELNSETRIHVYASSNTAFTKGLSGNGYSHYFVSDESNYAIITNGSGEAIRSLLYSINITVTGGHGTITTDPAGKATSGTIVTVIPHPDDGYYLSSLYRDESTDILATRQFKMYTAPTEITASFSEKTSITPSVNIADNIIYGNTASPSVDGNTGNGDVTYKYKVKDSADETYSENFPPTIGTYTIQAIIAETEQYYGATCTKDFTILQRDATVTALAQTITYGDNIVTSPSASAMETYATLTNGVSGHTITALTLAKTQTEYSATAYNNDITPSSATIKDEQNNDVTANYNISYVNGDLTINQRAVTVTAKAQTITYGSNIVTNPEADVMDTYATLTNGVSGHAITALTLAKTQTEYSATAYSNDITPSSATIKDAQSNDVSANYNISYSNGDLTINKKDVTVTALPQTIIYGSNIVTTPATAEISTYATLTDALDGHTLTAITLAKTKTNVSETAHVGDITPSEATIQNGETDVTSNYSISYANGDLTIQPYDISTTALTITPIDDQTYTGSAIEPTTSVTVDALSDEALTADYSYSEDHTNVGTVNISLTGIGNFTGTNTNATSYKIVPKALEDGMIAAISDEPYNGSGVEPEITVTYNEQSLTKGTHYTTSFESNTIPGEATVTITAVDNTNYSGTATATFNVIAANLSTATVTGEDVVTKVYDGTTAFIVPESDVEVKFGSNPKLTDEYQIVYRKAYRSDTESLSSITDIGEYTIVIRPKEGNTYVTGEKVSTLKVNVQLPVGLKQCEWVTYYDERFDLVTPEGYQAYKVATASSNGVTAETIDYIPKGVPVILKTTVNGTSDNSMTINLNEQQTPSAVVGATEFKGVASTSDGEMPTGTAYILVGKKFVLFEGTEGIPKHRCYLEFAAPAGTRSIGIGFENGGSTSIHDVKNIDNRERWYDLQGQRIEQPKRKGLYIKDGQKVVIK